MLEVRQLGLSYPDAKPLWKGISFSLDKGQALHIKGANGCGKTSLLYALCNVIPQQIRAERIGDILLDGNLTTEIPLNQLLPKMSISLANPRWELFFSTPEDEIIFALENLGRAEDEISERLEYVYDALGLRQWKDFPSHKLSVGWQKMVSLAVQAAVKPDVLLLDEPLAALAGNNATSTITWLQKYLQEGGILITADHSEEITKLQPMVLNLAEVTS